MGAEANARRVLYAVMALLTALSVLFASAAGGALDIAGASHSSQMGVGAHRVAGPTTTTSNYVYGGRTQLLDVAFIAALRSNNVSPVGVALPGSSAVGLPTTDGDVVVAANGGGKLLWTSWRNYPKVTQAGREYAQIGDRLYTRHAVDRMQPSGLGAPAGATGPGRSISPNFVEDVIGSSRGVPVKGPNGEVRLSHTSGSAQVITERAIVITVITR